MVKVSLARRIAVFATTACFLLFLPTMPAAAAPSGSGTVVALDSGRSMTETGFQAARQAVQDFAESSPSGWAGSLGLTTSGGEISTPPSEDLPAIAAAVRSVQLSGEPQILDAVAAAVPLLNPFENRRILVVSAGGDTGSARTAAQVTLLLKDAKVSADVLAIGSKAGDDAALRELASTSGGTLKVVAKASDVPDAFADLAVAASPASDGSDKSAEPAAPVQDLPEPVTAANTGSGSPGMGLWIVVLLCAGAFAAFGMVLVQMLGSETSDVGRRIDQFRSKAHTGGGGGAEEPKEETGVVGGLLEVSNKLVTASGKGDRIAAELSQAGWKLRPHEWALLRGTACFVAVFGLWFITGNVLVSLVLGLILPVVVARILLGGARNRRMQAFADQLPDALSMIASSLRAGFTVSQALERLSDQDIDPLGPEMARALAQTKIGVTTEDALEQVSVRMNCPDLGWVVMSIRIQREVGGNLADILETTMETMRERTRLRRQIRALSAEGRLSAYLLIGLPIVLSIGLMLMRPEYMSPLFNTPLGLFMVIAGAGMIVLGWFWISRMIKIDA